MVIKGLIKSGEYFDSVTLMQVARGLTGLDGVKDAAVVMGTAENKSILSSSGLLIDLFQNARDADLLIAVKAESESAVTAAFNAVDALLGASRKRIETAGEYAPKSIQSALKYLPGANLALISIAGKYAGGEAMKALRAGLHVMLFSDNVPLDMELKLKKYAAEKDLLMMGPDCGTAIINGTPLAFANVVQQGDIGIVAASGTGLQEISCIISNSGAGISQAIGVGGRDVKDAVGGIMFLKALKALAEDPATRVIVLVSKPPEPGVMNKIREAVQDIDKPVVATFLGWDMDALRSMGLHAAETLEENALLAVELSGKGVAPEQAASPDRIMDLARREMQRLKPGRRYIRGLYAGGTLCDETQLILGKNHPKIYSNTPLNPENTLPDAWQSLEHTVIDMGDDAFTVGRPHPMIDYSLRNRRIDLEAADPETAVILLDVVLGYGSAPEPGVDLRDAIRAAREKMGADDYVSFICSITGTPDDPQDMQKVKKELEDAGVIIMPANAAAARLADAIAVGIAGGR